MTTNHGINPAGPSTNKANWPVYDMGYQVHGRQRKIRVEWRYKPKFLETVTVVLQCLEDYMADPSDVTYYRSDETFRSLQPDCCIVIADGHKTGKSKSSRPPDEEFHITVRFGKRDSRQDRGGMGYTVHIYLNESNNKYDPERETRWDGLRRDDYDEIRVYQDRNQWPEGTNENKGLPFPAPATKNSTPAALPTTQAWQDGAEAVGQGRGGRSSDDLAGYLPLTATNQGTPHGPGGAGGQQLGPAGRGAQSFSGSVQTQPPGPANEGFPGSPQLQSQSSPPIRPNSGSQRGRGRGQRGGRGGR
ncbi:hypothetical protein FQN54_006173 [Arachnomyces sp. PD_36]|nr:hypothetical protein FQN54_006173 [Arachnomyces sp. PD_36]